MRIQIDTGSRLDQSGDTTFGFSNHTQRAFRLKQSERDACMTQLTGRELSKHMLIFAACVFLLIRDHLVDIEHLQIDDEYAGHQGDIKRQLVNLIKRHDNPKFDESRIEVRSITKKSPEHEVAWRTYRNERRADKNIKAEEVLAILNHKYEKDQGLSDLTVAVHSYTLSRVHYGSWSFVLSLYTR